MKLFISIILFFTLINHSKLFSNEIFISEFNTINYPNLELDFFIIDTLNNNLRTDLNLSDFLLSENGEFVNLQSYNNSQTNINVNSSILISLDISGSMQGDNLNNAKEIIIKISNLLNNDYDELALNTFNHKPFLNSIYTNDFSAITNKLGLINTRGTSNLDNLFDNDRLGVFKILEYSKFQNNVILITDSEDLTKLDNIILKANANNLKITVIDLNENENSSLSELAKKTGGVYINNKVNTVSSVLVYQNLKNSKPAKIKFETENCSLDRSYTLILSNQYFIDFKYSFKNQNLPYLDVSPSQYLEFGFTKEGQANNKNLSIEAKNSDIYIDSIYVDCDRFKVDFNGPFLLQKDFLKLVEIDYIAYDEEYHICNLTIKTQKCGDIEVILTGGKRDPSSYSDNLNITSPGNNNVFIGNSDTTIKWEGILPIDDVIIEFRDNPTAQWDTIVNKTSQLFYENWNVKNINSSNSELKVSQLISDDKLSNIIYLEDFGFDGFIADWNPNGDYLVYFDDEFNFKTWDSNKKNVINQFNIGSNVSNIKCNPNNELFAFTIDNDRNKLIALNAKNDNELEIDFGLHNSRINSIDWNVDGTLLTAGLSEGIVKFWDQFDNDFKPNSATITKDFDNKINIIEWNKGEFSDVIAIVDSINNFYLYEYSKDLTTEFNIGFATEELIDLKWNKLGNKILYSDGIRLSTANIIRDINQNNILKIVNIENKTQKLSNYISSDWSSDGTKIIISTKDSIFIINESDGSQQYSFPGHNDTIRFIDIEKDFVISASDDEEIEIWHIDSLHEKGVLQTALRKFKIEKYRPFLDNFEIGTKCIGFNFDTLISFSILNNNSIPVKIDSVFISNDNSNEIEILNEFPIYLNRSSFLELHLLVIPKTISDEEFEVVIDAYEETFTFSIARDFIKPDLELSNNSIDFQAVNINQSSQKRSISITNTSNNDIDILNKSEFNFEDKFEVIGLDGINKIDANSTIDFDLIYKPSELTLSEGQLILTTSDLCTPIEIDLLGNGVAPQITGNRVFNIGDIICDVQNSLPFTITNSGNGTLNITEINSLSGNLSFNSTSFTIVQNETKAIEIDYINNKAGNFEEFVEIISNTNIDRTESNTFTLKFRKEVSSFTFDKDSLIFLDLDENLSYRQSFFINNTGSINLSFPKLFNDKFKVISITPEIISPGSVSEVVIEFEGGNDGESFLDSLIFTDNCDNSKTIYLKANIDAKGPLLSLENKNVIIKTITCENNKQDTILSFSNIGNKPLIISKISVDNNFTLSDIDGIINTEYNKGESFQFKVSFDKDLFGTFNNIITLKTNEDSGEDYLISLNASRDYIKLEFRYDDPWIEKIYPNTTFNSTINISKVGNLNYSINGFQDATNFIVDSIAYNDNTKDSIVHYSFINGNPETEYYDTLLINSDCGLIRLPLRINVRGNNFIFLKTNDIDVNTYEKFNIKLSIENPNNLDIGNPKTISGDLVINLTSAIVITQSYVENTQKTDSTLIVPFEIRTNKFGGIIEEIEFRATRGNTSMSEISIENAEFIDFNDYFIRTTASKMTVNIPDSGFVVGRDSVYLKNIYPNPANNIINIEFGLIETGNYSLELYDFNGIRVDIILQNVITLQELNENNIFNYAYNINALSIGYYQLRLKTESNLISKKFLILR